MNMVVEDFNQDGTLTISLIQPIFKIMGRAVNGIHVQIGYQKIYGGPLLTSDSIDDLERMLTFRFEGQIIIDFSKVGPSGPTWPTGPLGPLVPIAPTWSRTYVTTPDDSITSNNQELVVYVTVGTRMQRHKIDIGDPSYPTKAAQHIFQSFVKLDRKARDSVACYGARKIPREHGDFFIDPGGSTSYVDEEEEDRECTED